MQDQAYRLMAELEAEHWWYRGRRALVSRLLARLDLPAGARLLDVGAGTGGNLALLGGFGEAWGIEPSRLGEALGQGSWSGRVLRAAAEEIPFRDASFDLVAALDVLEHLHDELAALDEFRRVLRPGGAVVLHVPAYRLLWGHEDVISRHLRRYRAPEIRCLLEAAGFTVLHLGYANTLLFPAIAAVKVGKRILLPLGEAGAGAGAGARVHADVTSLPPAPVNALLAAILEAEAEVAASAELPFGASILAAGRKA